MTMVAPTGAAATAPSYGVSNIPLGLAERLDTSLFQRQPRAQPPVFQCQPPAAKPQEAKHSTCTFRAPVPEAGPIGTHAATIHWQPLEPRWEGPSTEVSSSLRLVLQEQDVTLPAKGKSARAPALSTHEWKEAYRGLALSCQVGDLKPGRTYLARLLVEATVAQQDRQHTAAAEQLPDANGEHAHGEAAQQPRVEVVCVPSAAISFSTQPMPPSAPAPASLSSRERKALKLKWAVPDETGGEIAGPLQYSLYCKPPPTDLDARVQPDAEGFVEVYTGSDKTAKVSKLIPGSRYTFRLKAANQVGDSLMSLCSTFSTQATVPSQPEPPTVSSSTPNSITLEWSRPHDNGSPIASYRLERDDGRDGSDFQLVYAGALMSTCASGLRSGFKYSFRLMAENDEGKSVWSAPTVATTAAVAPGSPSSLAMVSGSRTSATLSWRPPEDDGGSVVVGYDVQLQAKCQAALEHMGTEWMTIFQGDALACTINSLRAGCTYRARVRAASAASWSLFSVPVDVVTAPDVPDAPEPPKLGMAQACFLGVEWQPPGHTGGAKITHYRLDVAREEPCACGTCGREGQGGQQAAITSGAPGLAAAQPVPLLRPCRESLSGSSVQLSTAGDVCAAEIRDLTPSTGYFFRVAAGNSQGLGPWSEWARLSTLADVPLAPEGLRGMAVAPAPAASLAAVGSSSSTGSDGACIALFWEPAQLRGTAVTQYVAEMAAAAGDEGEADAEDEAPGQRQYAVMYSGTACTCQVKGLRPAAGYLFRVAAVSTVGTGPWSAVVHVVTAAAAPEAPEGLVAEAVATAAGAAGVDADDGTSAGEGGTSDDGCLLLRWRPPPRDNGAAVSAYVVEVAAVPAWSASGARRISSSASGSTWAMAIQTSAAETSGLVQGLLPSRAYQFRVRAANAVGLGPAGDAVVACTAAAPPPPPIRLQVVSRTSCSLRVRWDEPPEDNGAAVQSYRLEMGVCRRVSEDQQQQDMLAIVVPQQQSAGLREEGGGMKDEASVGKEGPRSTGRRSNGSSSSGHSINGINGADAEAVEVWQLAYTGRETLAKVSGLQPDTRYMLRCRCISAAGSGPWSAATAVTTTLAPPGPPLALAVSPVQAGAAQLRWQASDDPPSCAPAVGFEVAVAAGGAGAAPSLGTGPEVSAAWHLPVAKVTVGRGVSSCMVEGLGGDMWYVARLRAVGAEGSGHSAWSAEVAFYVEGQRGSLERAGSVPLAVAAVPGKGKGGGSGRKDGKARGGGLAPSAAAVSALPAAALALLDDSSASGSSCAPDPAPAAAVATTASALRRGAPAASRKSKAVLAAAAATPMAAARPSRRSLLAQAWRKGCKMLWRNWWKVLLAVLIVALLRGAYGLLH